MKNLPENNFGVVTIIVACRNERDFIRKCLDSILAQGYPKENLEVFVVDGMSIDKTRKIVAGYRQKYPFIKLLENPKKITPCAFNIGIKNAKGDYIIIMGAHAEYPQDYISKCVAHLAESGADNVGGIASAKPAKNNLVAKAIALALSSHFAAGGAFRMDFDKPREVDTVFGGCYKKEVFEKIGLFNEELARSQDMEFNIRLKKNGGKIMIFPDIAVNYYPKSNFKDFFIHNFWDGVWAVYPAKFVKIPLKLRHYLPLVFVAALAGLAFAAFFWPPAALILAAAALSYVALSLFFSAKVATKEKDWRYLFLTPPAFLARHFGYGIGSFYGVAKLLMPIKNGRKKN